MGRGKRTSKAGRDGGGFVAIPWTVLDSAAYRSISYPARALLIEFARQLDPYGHNNGALLCSRDFMCKRGWTSWDVVHRAKQDLIAAGFVHETVKGQRPNKASWYAVTWFALGKLDGLDAGAAESFKRAAYKSPQIAAPKPTRAQLYAKWNPIPSSEATSAP